MFYLLNNFTELTIYWTFLWTIEEKKWHGSFTNDERTKWKKPNVPITSCSVIFKLNIAIKNSEENLGKDKNFNFISNDEILNM